MGSYVVVSIRDHEGRFEMLSVCEGDHDYYQFDTAADREAALDYLFLWYAAGKSWAPLTWEQRERLDEGGFEVDPKFRGPYSNARADAAHGRVAT